MKWCPVGKRWTNVIRPARAGDSLPRCDARNHGHDPGAVELPPSNVTKDERKRRQEERNAEGK